MRAWLKEVWQTAVLVKRAWRHQSHRPKMYAGTGFELTRRILVGWTCTTFLVSYPLWVLGAPQWLTYAVMGFCAIGVGVLAAMLNFGNERRNRRRFGQRGVYPLTPEQRELYGRAKRVLGRRHARVLVLPSLLKASSLEAEALSLGIPLIAKGGTEYTLRMPGEDPVVTRRKDDLPYVDSFIHMEHTTKREVPDGPAETARSIHDTWIAPAEALVAAAEDAKAAQAELDEALRRATAAEREALEARRRELRQENFLLELRELVQLHQGNPTGAALQDRALEYATRAAETRYFIPGGGHDSEQQLVEELQKAVQN